MAVSFYNDEPKCYTNENEWNLHLSNNSLALKHQNLEGWFSDIIKDISNAASEVVHEIGSVIQAVDNFLDKVEHFVIKKVEEGFQLVIKVAGQAIDTIIHTVEQAWTVISTFVKKVIDTIEKIVEYLGYLFNWDDILLMHEFLKNTFLITAKQYQIDINNPQSNLNSFVDPVFDKAISYLESLKKERQPIDNPDTSSGSNIFSGLLNNPVVNFINDIIGRGLSLLDGDGGQDNLPVFEFSGQISSRMEKIVNDLISTITGSISSISLSNIGDSVNTILDKILDGILDVAEDLLATGRDLTKYLIKFIGELIDYILRIINARINIPIVTWLYENIIAKGSTLTLLDVVSLVISIPTTIITKSTHCFDSNLLQKTSQVSDYQSFFKTIGLSGVQQLIPYTVNDSNHQNLLQDSVLYDNDNALNEDSKKVILIVSTITAVVNLVGGILAFFVNRTERWKGILKLCILCIVGMGLLEILFTFIYGIIEGIEGSALLFIITNFYFAIYLIVMNCLGEQRFIELRGWFTLIAIIIISIIFGVGWFKTKPKPSDEEKITLLLSWGLGLVEIFYSLALSIEEVPIQSVIFIGVVYCSLDLYLLFR